MISIDLDGGATEVDGRASAPVGPSVATPLHGTMKVFTTDQQSYVCDQYILREIQHQVSVNNNDYNYSGI